MINIRDWESRRTHQAWGTGIGSPALMVLACLVVNFIALLVAVIINLTLINDGYNDFGYGLGWIMFAPAPCLSFIWTLIDIALCHYSVLHPNYYLTESTFLAMLNAGFGIAGTMIYSWDEGASWLPGIFIFFSMVVYIYIMVISSIRIHETNKTRNCSRCKTCPRCNGVA